MPELYKAFRRQGDSGRAYIFVIEQTKQPGSVCLKIVGTQNRKRDFVLVSFLLKHKLIAVKDALLHRSFDEIYPNGLTVWGKSEGCHALGPKGRPLFEGPERRLFALQKSRKTRDAFVLVLTSFKEHEGELKQVKTAFVSMTKHEVLEMLTAVELSTKQELSPAVVAQNAEPSDERRTEKNDNNVKKPRPTSPLHAKSKKTRRKAKGEKHVKTTTLKRRKKRDRQVLNSAGIACLFCKGETDLRFEDEEQLYVIWLDRLHRVIKIQLVPSLVRYTGLFGRGRRQSLTFNMVDIFLDIPSGAEAVAFVHNHPGEEIPRESIEDMETTKLLRKHCQREGLEFFDHVIIGEKGYMSFREQKRYPRFP